MPISKNAILSLSYTQQAPLISHSLMSHRVQLLSIATPNKIGPGIVPKKQSNMLECLSYTAYLVFMHTVKCQADGADKMGEQNTKHFNQIHGAHIT